MTMYLDNAATSWPKPPTVARAAARVLKEAGGNPGRAGHDQATRAGAMVNDVRRQAAALFGAADAEQVVFGLNGTDCLNMAMHGVLAGAGIGVGTGGGGGGGGGGAGRGRGRVAHVITSAYDHNSVQRMLNAAEAAGAIELTRVGRIDEPIWRAADVLKALRPETVLVALTHASNVTGAVGDVAAVGAGLRRAAGIVGTGSAESAAGAAKARAQTRRARAVLLVDAAQSAGVVPIDMAAMGIDLLAMPGHKGLMGPTGTGLLLVDRAVGPRLAPWRMGGTGLDSMDPFQPTQFPTRMEAGTANTFGLAGLQAALTFVEKQSVAAIGRHERALRARLVARLSKGALKKMIRLHAAEADRRAEGRGADELNEVVGVLSMDFFGAVAVSDVAAILNSDFGIALRSGLHCAPYTHRLIGTLPQGTLRVSPGFFNTAAEIDRMAAALTTVLRAFKPARQAKARRA